MILKITSPIPPSVNKYLNYRVQRVNGRVFVQAYKSAETVTYENIFKGIVQDAMREYNWVQPEKGKYIVVEAIFYFPRLGFDSNNHWKVPLDVFSYAGVYGDDSSAIERVQRVYVDKENPRVEFTIKVSEIVGIFDDEKHLEDFKNFNCRFCTKDSNKCSIMKEALQNKINRENIDLDSLNCLRKKIKKT